ncbi:hypothetical protein [Anaerotruncus rubiinfantis]|uniref:hypothetical protein n=1 Tax=Anaerotruncus rubiinfantis TaxID=1720200 RepID=UPI00082E7C9E|nr:hypothetical protein [Anaerotruncus rubiinfantis]
MNRIVARELQEKITHEAIAMIALGGKEAAVGNHTHTVELIGKAWGLQPEKTSELTERIRKGQTEGLPDEATADRNLLANWSGLEILDVQEGLFETAIRLESFGERTILFNMAQEIGETQNLLDWIEKAPDEKQTWMAPAN